MPTDGGRVREKLATDYRMACPEGHTSLAPAETTPTAYCQTCGQSYPFEALLDRRFDADPVREA